MAKTDWTGIQEHATSDNSLLRKHSLSQAVTELEKALVASGVNCTKERKIKHKSLADMFLDIAEDKGWLPEHGWNIPIQKDIFGDLLRKSIAARNKGVHSDQDIAEAECEQYVDVIHMAWQLLHDHFVTQLKAAGFAKLFLESTYIEDPVNEDDPNELIVRAPNFSEVYLYGSLARQTDTPNDIDLLLILSSGARMCDLTYSADNVDKEQSILRDLDEWEREPKFNIPQNIAAVACGWLNLSLIDEQFGHERIRTAEIAALERDPLFFLNVARDMLRYDPTQGVWVRDLRSLPVFCELTALREELVKIGILPASSVPTAAQQRKHTLTVTISDTTLARIDEMRKARLMSEYVSRQMILEWAVMDWMRVKRDQRSVSML